MACLGWEAAAWGMARQAVGLAQRQLGVVCELSSMIGGKASGKLGMPQQQAWVVPSQETCAALGPRRGRHAQRFPQAAGSASHLPRAHIEAASSRQRQRCLYILLGNAVAKLQKGTSCTSMPWGMDGMACEHGGRQQGEAKHSMHRGATSRRRAAPASPTAAPSSAPSARSRPASAAMWRRVAAWQAAPV